MAASCTRVQSANMIPFTQVYPPPATDHEQPGSLRPIFCACFKVEDGRPHPIPSITLDSSSPRRTLPQSLPQAQKYQHPLSAFSSSLKNQSPKSQPRHSESGTWGGDSPRCLLLSSCSLSGPAFAAAGPQNLCETPFPLGSITQSLPQTLSASVPHPEPF